MTRPISNHERDFYTSILQHYKDRKPAKSYAERNFVNNNIKTINNILQTAQIPTCEDASIEQPDYERGYSHQPPKKTIQQPSHSSKLLGLGSM